MSPPEPNCDITFSYISKMSYSTVFTHSIISCNQSRYRPSISQFSPFPSPDFKNHAPCFRTFRLFSSNPIPVCEIFHIVIPPTVHLFPESVHQCRHSVAYFAHSHKCFLSSSCIFYVHLTLVKI